MSISDEEKAKWDAWLNEYIDERRRLYTNLILKKIIDSSAPQESFHPPVQVSVIIDPKHWAKYLLLFYSDRSKADKTFEYKVGGIDKFPHYLPNIFKQTYWSFSPLTEKAKDAVRRDINFMIGLSAREEQLTTIKDSTKSIEEALSEIPSSKIRQQLEDATLKIKDATEKISEHDKMISEIRGEFGDFRRMVNIPKEFQDWRLLASTVSEIKDTYVRKDLHESEIKRLETAITDLKKIKILSWRTALEIVLGLVALITTLIAMGILKF